MHTPLSLFSHTSPKTSHARSLLFMAIHVNEYNSTGAENNEIVMKYRKKKNTNKQTVTTL